MRSACDYKSLDGLGSEANTDPASNVELTSSVETTSSVEPTSTVEPIPTKDFGDFNIIQGKGQFLGGGATGLVERLESGDAIKSPWTGRPTALDCREEIVIEARIYQRLGVHPRLVKLKHWDPVDYTLTLEYMPHGNLKEYITTYGQTISRLQRQKWAIEAAEGIQLLHSNGIIQGDVGPHNFLLDKDLSLKICDFGGSSVDGSRPMVVAGVRYRLPSLAGRYMQPVTIEEDLFALGSTIYFIATGYEPYNELTDEDEVEKLYRDGVFPILSGVPFAEAIALCWRQEVKSAQTIIEIVRR